MLHKRQLITSALPYINGIKHLGNLIGSLLPADVCARFLRQQGCEVLFICATDEHGTPAELGAAAEGVSTPEYCEKEYKKQADIYRRFQLSFDHFGRTSRRQNHELTQYFGNKLYENGYITERPIKQLFSLTDNRYLPDRYVEGTCPHCGYDKARGDQCESCTSVLDPTDLINPHSAISGSTDLEVRESRHLFLQQSKLTARLREWIDSKTDWPALVRSIALKWLNEGLEDRCITRDLEWGVPVGRPGFENKVYYVWFDAPIGYIAATKEWSDLKPTERDWRSWWFDTDDVYYTQFLGKDNVPFHTMTFPATLFGTNEPWKTVDYIKGFNWLNYYGGKFSTSQKRGVFTSDALEILPSDYWRYYLLARAPESSDSSFTWPELQSVINKDLADVFGNFINRTLRFSNKHFGEVVPEGGSWGEPEQAFVTEVEQCITRYTNTMQAKEYRKAMAELRDIWSSGNEYLTVAAPWHQIKTDREKTAAILRLAINFINIIAVLSAPAIPETSARVLAALNQPSADNRWINIPVAEALQQLPGGHPYQIPPVLFQKITDEDVAAFESRFGGPRD